MANLTPSAFAWYLNSGPTIGVTDLATANNSAGATLTLAITVPANALVVVCVNEVTATSTGSLSDGTNTYSAGPTTDVGTVSGFAMLFYHYYSTGGTFTLTYTKAGTGHATTMAALFATGVVSSSPLDTGVSATASSLAATTSVTSGAPSVSGELIIAFEAWSNSTTITFTQQTAPPAFLTPPDASTTQATASLGGGSFQYCGTNAITFSPTLSGSPTGSAAIIVGFKPASAPSGYYAVTPWPKNTAVTCGNLIRQNLTPTVGNERVFVCGVAGTTTNGTEPTWTITRYGATTNNTATWYECTGNPALNGDFTNCLTWALQHASSIAVTTGLIIYDVTSGSLQILTTAGNLGSSSPTFSATAGTVTSETGAGTAKWTSLGLASGFSIWGAPFARLQSAWTSTWEVAGNTTFVSASHAETQSSSMTLTPPGTIASISKVYCVLNAPATTPPGSADVVATPTGSITTTGSTNLTLSSSGSPAAYYSGLIFAAGSGASSGIFTGGHEWARFDNCAIRKNGTTAVASGAITFNGSYQELNNTTVQFGATGDGMAFARGAWRNTASAIQGATLPTALITNVAGCAMICEGIDFTALGSGHTIVGAGVNQSAQGKVSLINCAFGASVTIAATPLGPGWSTNVIISDSSGTNYQQQLYAYQGVLTTSTSVVRTGGASLFGTPLSWDIATTANSAWPQPFVAQTSFIANSTTSSNVAVIIYGIWFGAALPNNDQIWHDVEYMGSASSPIASLGSGTKANGLATGVAWAADTSAWDSEAASWISNHSYSLGAIIAGSSVSNSGRVFICTQAGTSTNGSAPAAFASAVDGGSVTDNGAKWQAGWRFAMTVTLSSPQPALAGYLHSYVKAALASSTFYIDPQIVL